jgi:hypothetical protein
MQDQENMQESKVVQLPKNTGIAKTSVIIFNKRQVMVMELLGNSLENILSEKKSLD